MESCQLHLFPDSFPEGGWSSVHFSLASFNIEDSFERGLCFCLLYQWSTFLTLFLVKPCLFWLPRDPCSLLWPIDSLQWIRRTIWVIFLTPVDVRRIDWWGPLFLSRHNHPRSLVTHWRSLARLPPSEIFRNKCCQFFMFIYNSELQGIWGTLIQEHSHCPILTPVAILSGLTESTSQQEASRATRYQNPLLPAFLDLWVVLWEPQWPPLYLAPAPSTQTWLPLSSPSLCE